jgi:secreted trypsin-like serine protease
VRIRSGVVAAALVVAAFGALSVSDCPAAEAVHRGEDARIEFFPFMVSLRLATAPDDPRCGGTLIEPDVVLTAAHCVAGVPQRGIVAVVGADVPDWPDAPRVATVGHAVPETYGRSRDNRHDLAVLRLAAPQSTPTIGLSTVEPRVGDHVLTVGWGCTNAPPVCQQRATTLQATRQVVLDERRSCGTDVFWTEPRYHAATTICTRGVSDRSTINRGDSGGPLLVRGGCGAGLRQVGVTSLGSDSRAQLHAGFASIPVEVHWIAGAIRSLPTA